MTRGQTSMVGDTRWSQNGYHYTKTSTCWTLTHHIIAERQLGRKIDKTKETVRFKDRNRQNLDPSNIEVVPKKGVSKEKRRIDLLTKIEDLKDQLAALDEDETEPVGSLGVLDGEVAS